jgi:hypothetical protein
MNIWTLLLIGIGAIQAIGLFAFLCGVFRAPAGFQDESGFHLGTESGLPPLASRALLASDDEDTLPPFPFDRAA